MTPPNATDTRARRKPLVQVERLSKLFPLEQPLLRRRRFVRAIDNISLHIRHAETLGVLGESSAGKTVLGHTMLRLLDPSYGRIVFDGTDITQMSDGALRPLRSHMQIVMQDPDAALNATSTVGELVRETMRAHRIFGAKSEIDARSSELLDRLGLPRRIEARRPDDLSQGERQRVNVARALAGQPKFVVCDEPVAMLDPSTRADVVNLLLETQDTHRTSYLFLSHDVSIVKEIAHRVAVMYLGRIIELGPAGDLFSMPLHPYTRALLGASPMAQPGRRRLRVVLAGGPPDPAQPPPGCGFHPRCPRAVQGQCDVDAPDLHAVDDSGRHRVACWHPHDESLG